MHAPTPSFPDPAAGPSLAGLRAWILTDGKAGDLNQCLGIAGCLGLDPDIRTIAPRAPWRWLMPLSWRLPPLAIDPGEAPGRAEGPLAPPFPDLVIAAGRRAAAYLPAIKRASGGNTFTVFLRDPRTSPAIADFLWVPAHDRLRAPNVMTTLLSPHKVVPARLEALRQTPPARIAALPTPRVALLIGGDSKDFTFTPADIARFSASVIALAATGVGVMATASRRTPPALAAAIRETIETHGGWFWDGKGPDGPGENPYLAFLANADALVVTAESVNMIGEALATGRPVHLFRPSGGSRKIDQFLRGLEARGLVHPFSLPLQTGRHQPFDETGTIAAEVARRHEIHLKERSS